MDFEILKKLEVMDTFQKPMDPLKQPNNLI